MNKSIEINNPFKDKGAACMVCLGMGIEHGVNKPMPCSVAEKNGQYFIISSSDINLLTREGFKVLNSVEMSKAIAGVIKSAIF